MSVNEKLAALAGEWKGTNRLYFTPNEPAQESASTALVTLRINGQFLGIAYDWTYEGGRQEGLLIIGCDTKSDAVQAVWTDSWHMSHKFMLCDGTVDGDGKVDIKGYYAVPDHPDWGWRTEIIPGDAGFKYIMYNVSPEGTEELAVETEFIRSEPSA